MARIGIVTCSNTTQDSGCSSFMCLKGVNENTGEFERYKNQGGTELMGIISCAGCPTAIAPEKLLRRVRSLSFLQLDAIHLSSCMMSLCPFKNKYARLLKNHFTASVLLRESMWNRLKWSGCSLRVSRTCWPSPKRPWPIWGNRPWRWKRQSLSDIETILQSLTGKGSRYGKVI